MPIPLISSSTADNANRTRVDPVAIFYLPRLQRFDRASELHMQYRIKLTLRMCHAPSITQQCAPATGARRDACRL